MRTEMIKIVDKHGFHYEVKIEHHPHYGFSNAFYDGRVIGQVELNKIHEPFSDNDSEWEAYEERFSEWSDEIKINMNAMCINYFNNQYDRREYN